MVPFAQAKLEIACALLAMPARRFRGHANRAASRFRKAIFGVHPESATSRQTQWRSQRRRRPKRQKSAKAKFWRAHAASRVGERVSRSRTFSIGGDDAYA